MTSPSHSTRLRYNRRTCRRQWTAAVAGAQVAVDTTLVCPLMHAAADRKRRAVYPEFVAARRFKFAHTSPSFLRVIRKDNVDCVAVGFFSVTRIPTQTSNSEPVHPAPSLHLVHNLQAMAKHNRGLATLANPPLCACQTCLPPTLGSAPRPVGDPAVPSELSSSREGREGGGREGRGGRGREAGEREGRGRGEGGERGGRAGREGGREGRGGGEGREGGKRSRDEGRREKRVEGWKMAGAGKEERMEGWKGGKARRKEGGKEAGREGSKEGREERRRKTATWQELRRDPCQSFQDPACEPCVCQCARTNPLVPVSRAAGQSCCNIARFFAGSPLRSYEPALSPECLVSYLPFIIICF